MHSQIIAYYATKDGVERQSVAVADPMISKKLSYYTKFLLFIIKKYRPATFKFFEKINT